MTKAQWRCDLCGAGEEFDLETIGDSLAEFEAAIMKRHKAISGLRCPSPEIWVALGASEPTPTKPQT